MNLTNDTRSTTAMATRTVVLVLATRTAEVSPATGTLVRVESAMDAGQDAMGNRFIGTLESDSNTRRHICKTKVQQLYLKVIQQGKRVESASHNCDIPAILTQLSFVGMIIRENKHMNWVKFLDHWRVLRALDVSIFDAFTKAPGDAL